MKVSTLTSTQMQQNNSFFAKLITPSISLLFNLFFIANLLSINGAQAQQECGNFEMLDWVVPDNINRTKNVFSHFEFPTWYNGYTPGINDYTHPGVDIWVPQSGSSYIINQAHGFVEKARKHYSGSIKDYIIIRHPNFGPNNADVYSIYLHLAGAAFQSETSEVFAGDTLGLVGITNTVPHTHFEIRHVYDTNATGHEYLFNPNILAGPNCSVPNTVDCRDVSNDVDRLAEYIDPCSISNLFQLINDGVDINVGRNTENIFIRIPAPDGANFSNVNASDILHRRMHQQFFNLTNFQASASSISFDIPINFFDFASLNEHKKLPLSFTVDDGELYRSYGALVNFVGQFQDVNGVIAAEFLSEEINLAADYGLFKGYSNGNFGRNDLLTKGQAAKIIVSAAHKLNLLDIDKSYTHTYQDVNPEDHFFPYVQTLYNLLGPDINIGLPIQDGVEVFNYEDNIEIGHCMTWLQELMLLTPNNNGIDRKSSIVVPNSGSSRVQNALRKILKTFNLKPNESVESVLNYWNAFNVTSTMNRSMMAKAIVNSYEIRSNEVYGGILRSSSNFQNYTVIGDKQEIQVSGQPNTPSLSISLDTAIFESQGPIRMGTNMELDPFGQPYIFYWTSDGGSMTELHNSYKKVEWSPPNVSVPTTFKVYFWVGQKGGRYGEAHINITVYPDSNNPLPTSINLSAIINPTTANAFQVIQASGQALYNTGDAVGYGTVTINNGQNSWTTATDVNGNFSRNIIAPAASGNINFFITDGGLSDSENEYITINYGSSGNNYDVVEYLTCVYGNGNQGCLGPTSHIKHYNSRVYAWLELENITTPTQARMKFYRPNGTHLWTFTSNYSDPGVPGWWYWSYLDIDGESISDHQGTWTVEVEAKSQGGSWDYLGNLEFILSHILAEHKMATAIVNDQPVNPTNTFYQTDQMTNSWAHFTDYSNGLDVRADWYEPNGDLYESFIYAMPDPGSDPQAWVPDFYQWMYILIDGEDAEDKTGEWEIKYFSKDPFGNWDLEYTDDFQILEDPNVNPQINTTAPPSFLEGEEVYVNIIATDNAYLDYVELYWDDGTSNQDGWININANSFTKNYYSLGTYDEGDEITYYGKAWDNSGNWIGSVWKTITIEDSDTEGPEISDVTITDYNSNNDGIIFENEEIQITAVVSDTSGILDVSFFLNGDSIPLNSNYEILPGFLSPGTHYLTIRASDNDQSSAVSYYTTSFEVIPYILGCTDTTALNYNPSATVPDTSCVYCVPHLVVSQAVDGTYHSADSITTSGNVIIESGDNVQFKSNAIRLSPGIHAKMGSVFSADIDPCSTN